MKKGLIVGVVVVILGFLVVYSQSGIPEGAKEKKPEAGGYGGTISPRTPMIEYVDTPASPDEEKLALKGANLHLLVQPADMEKNLGKWTVVDCRPKDLYDEGHIPTAIHLGETCNDFFRDDLVVEGIGMIEDLKLGDVGELEKKLSKVGISMDKTILFYDQREDPGETSKGRYYGQFAGYVFVPFWYMEYMGHKDVRVLDGGIGAWKAEGKPIEQKANKLPPTQFKADVQRNRLATTEEVLKIAQKEEDAQLVDNRTMDEYLGEHQSPPKHFLEGKVRRMGRIPNTKLNVPHYFQFIDPNTAKLRPTYQLARLYQSLNKDKRTVLYCYIANRISLSYFVLRLLGFNDPAIYHDSWIVWGSDLSLPVEEMKMVAEVIPGDVDIGKRSKIPVKTKAPAKKPTKPKKEQGEAGGY
ncbi:MAG: sulfurtransferase [Nitrospirae bacterium]|nr:sulfurtransferase [Nitrospirota bacterium]